MTREMLSCRQHTFFFHTASIFKCVCCYKIRCFTESTTTDYWILWIIVHIKHWCKIHMHTSSLHLASCFLTIFIYKSLISHSTKRHTTRIVFHAIKTHSKSPFAIDCHHQWCASKCLELVIQRHIVVHTHFMEDKTSKVVSLYKFLQRVEFFALFAR